MENKPIRIEKERKNIDWINKGKLIESDPAIIQLEQLIKEMQINLDNLMPCECYPEEIPCDKCEAFLLVDSMLDQIKEEMGFEPK